MPMRIPPLQSVLDTLVWSISAGVLAFALAHHSVLADQERAGDGGPEINARVLVENAESGPPRPPAVTTERTAWITIAAMAVAAIGMNLVNVALTFYRGVRSIHDESTVGKLGRCTEEMEELRRQHAADLTAIRAHMQREIDRLRESSTGRIRDYEERLINKRAEIEYLHMQVNTLHEAGQQQLDTIHALTAQLVQMTEQLAIISQRSIQNTGDAIRCINAPGEAGATGETGATGPAGPKGAAGDCGEPAPHADPAPSPGAPDC